MKDLGVHFGQFPAVAWHKGDAYAAVMVTGGPLSVYRSAGGTGQWSTVFKALSARTNGVPKMYSDGDRLWCSYRDDNAPESVALVSSETGIAWTEPVRLLPTGGVNCSALGFGAIAVCVPTAPHVLTVRRRLLTGGDWVEQGDAPPMGISYLTPDAWVSWDVNRGSVPGMWNPARTQGLIVGEMDATGPRCALSDGRGGLLWVEEGEWKNAVCAASGDRRFLIGAWQDRTEGRVTVMTEAEIAVLPKEMPLPVVSIQKFQHACYVAPFKAVNERTDYGVHDGPWNAVILECDWRFMPSPKYAFADFKIADSVPDEWLRGIFISAEGALRDPVILERFERELPLSKQMAIRRRVPLVLNFDGGPWTQEFVNRYCQPQAGLEIVPAYELYPSKSDGSPDTLRIQWSDNLRFMSERFTRIAVCTSLYTQSDNYPLAYILGLQAVMSEMVQKYRPMLVAPFSVGRPSGAVTYPPLRKALDSWCAALTSELPETLHLGENMLTEIPDYSDEVHRIFDDGAFRMDSKPNLCRFKHAVALHLHFLDARFGLLKKNPGQNQCADGTGVDALLFKVPGPERSTAVDIVIASDDPLQARPGWSIDLNEQGTGRYVESDWVKPVVKPVVRSRHARIVRPYICATSFDLGVQLAKGDRGWLTFLQDRFTVARIVVASKARTERSLVDGLHQLELSLEALQSIGVRAEVIALCDTALYGMSEDDALNYFAAGVAIGKRYDNTIALWQHSNECYHGVEQPYMMEERFHRKLEEMSPEHWPVSWGATNGRDLNLSLVGGSCLTPHTDRQRTPAENGLAMGKWQEETGIDVVDDEPKGIQKNFAPGRQRTDDPDYGRQLAQAAIDNDLAGACLHLEAGMYADITKLDDIQIENTRAFIEVMRGEIVVPKAATREELIDCVRGLLFERIADHLKITGTPEQMRPQLTAWVTEKVTKLDEMYGRIMKRVPPQVDAEGLASRVRLYLEGWTDERIAAMLQESYDRGER